MMIICGAALLHTETWFSAGWMWLMEHNVRYSALLWANSSDVQYNDDNTTCNTNYTHLSNLMANGQGSISGSDGWLRCAGALQLLVDTRQHALLLLLEQPAK